MLWKDINFILIPFVMCPELDLCKNLVVKEEDMTLVGFVAQLRLTNGLLPKQQ
jgi:hypothetical protein